MTRTLPLFFFSICLMLSFFCNAAFCSSPLHAEPVTPVADIYGGLRADDVVNLTADQYAQLTGKRMNLRQRLGLSVLKIKLRKELKKNPDLLLSDYYKENKKMSTGWVVLLVVLSVLLLGLLVVAIAYGDGWR